MKINIVKSPSFDFQLFNEIEQTIKSFSGSIDFSFQSSEINENPEKVSNYFQSCYYGVYEPSYVVNSLNLISYEYEKFAFKKIRYVVRQGYSSRYRVFLPPHWMEFSLDLISKCRPSLNIPENEIIIFLTPIPNINNWFSIFGKNEAICHTSDWRYLLECEEKYPIIHNIVSNVIRILSNRSEGNRTNHQKEHQYSFEHRLNTFHSKPIGCINDFCEDKREVLIKLRTGDLCKGCLEKLFAAEINGDVISQLLKILAGIRGPMTFSDQFREKVKPGKLLINDTYQLILLDFGKKKIKLDPLELTIYLTVLSSLRGIHFNEFRFYREQLLYYYHRLKPLLTEAEVRETIDRLLQKKDLISQRINRIKRKIISLIGKDLADYYIIHGGKNMPKRIILDRSLVVSNKKEF
jgi:hypothetical protein